MRLSNLTTAELEQFVASCTAAKNLIFANLVTELIDRRAEAESELRQLERGLAYDNACSVIDGCCNPVFDLPEWFDVDDAAEFAGEAVDEAVMYLELRGLLERDPQRRNIVSIRNESEATA